MSEKGLLELLECVFKVFFVKVCVCCVEVFMESYFEGIFL